MDVTDPGNSQVDFTFRNFSALGSTITEVYFNDGTLLGILPPLFDSGAGVNFTNGRTYAQTIDSLDGLLTAPVVGGPALRVGLHVRSFSDGGSESFVNAIPESQT